MFTIALSNEKCKIKIVSAKDGTALGSVTGVKIKRRELGDTAWTVIFTKTVSSINDFDYTFYDKYTRSRRTYEYRVVPMIGATEGTAVDKSIECNFDEIYISDTSAEYILVLDADFTHTMNASVMFQKTLNSQFPRVIRNSAAKYESGTVSAIPLPLDARGNPTSVGGQKFKEQFINFLINGEQKLLKTYEGHLWAVDIGDTPKEEKAEVEGASKVSFDWTETDITPTYDG